VHDERRKRERDYELTQLDRQADAVEPETDEREQHVVEEPEEAHGEKSPAHDIHSPAVQAWFAPLAGPAGVCELARPEPQQRAVGEDAECVDEERREVQPVHGRRIGGLPRTGVADSDERR
jgi:hypothetical protein